MAEFHIKASEAARRIGVSLVTLVPIGGGPRGRKTPRAVIQIVMMIIMATITIISALVGDGFEKT